MNKFRQKIEAFRFELPAELPLPDNKGAKISPKTGLVVSQNDTIGNITRRLCDEDDCDLYDLCARGGTECHREVVDAYREKVEEQENSLKQLFGIK